MDPRKFDELVQKLSQTVTRRSIVGGTVGASVLTAVGLGSGDAGDDALAKGNRKHRAHGQGNGGNKKKAHGQGNGGKKHRNNKGGAQGEGGNKGRGGAHAEACIPTGKKCPSPKPRGRKHHGGNNNNNNKNRGHAKKLGCDRCCQGHFVVGSNGRNKCSCQPEGLACQTTTECCTGVCSGGLCITLS
jgi:hypothetical protein